MCTVHHLNVCTDVYLQGSWLRNEKIAASCLLADVKALSRAFGCVAFTQERSEHEDGKLFLSVTVLYCHDYLNFFSRRSFFRLSDLK